MKITKVKINRVSWEKWLIWFAQLILDDCLFIWWIGIFTRLSEPKKIRLVFPTKKKDWGDIKICYPMTESFYRDLEEEIQNKIWQI